jgi:ArsR family transcriptional regulator, arsenate/arsenite/antimonite-responsive transcriptional repressor
MRQIDALVRFYKALADSTRLQLVQLLATSRCGDAKCVSRLAQELGVTVSSVSQHLRILKDLGLVCSERRGYQIHYWLDQDGLAAYRELAEAELGEALAQVTVQASMRPANEDGCVHHDTSESCATMEGDCPLQTTPRSCACHGDTSPEACASEQDE